MTSKAPARIYSNVDTASQHPDRSTGGSDEVDVLSSQQWEQPSDWTISWQPAPHVVSEQMKKFLVTCLVVAGVGWLLAVVGICTDHWISYSLHDVGQSVTKEVDTVKPVTEAVNTVTDSVTDGGVVTKAVTTVTDAVDTAEMTEETDTEPPVTDVFTQPPIVTTSPEVMQTQNVITDVVTTTTTTTRDWGKVVKDMAENVAKEAEKAYDKVACEVQKWWTGNSSMDCSILPARVAVGLFDSEMDFDTWMVGVQGLILTGLIYATGGMVLMILHLVLKGRKPWMPTVGGVSCVVGGIFIITGIMVNFFKTPYHHEPDWSFFLTFNGGLLFMVAGVLILFLERYDRVQALRENKCSV